MGHLVSESQDVAPSCSLRFGTLRALLDGTLFFDSHVDNVCRAAHFHITALRHIRNCIDYDTARTVASSMVGVRLDYCNSLLYGTSIGNLSKLQLVMNTLAWVVSGTRKRDHITPVLADLHWLPVASRIHFKIALQTYKTITTRKPEYLADLLSFQTAPRSLLSSSKMRLRVDVARTVFASRAFHHAAPSIWNALPAHLTDFSLSLESFKIKLKTFLYNKSYRRWQSSWSALAIQSLHIWCVFIDIWRVTSCVLLLLLLLHIRLSPYLEIMHVFLQTNYKSSNSWYCISLIAYSTNWLVIYA